MRAQIVALLASALAVTANVLETVTANVLENGAREYLGIRYAEPPTGSKRWSAPVDAKELRHFEGTNNFSKFGPSCPQYGGQVYDEHFTSEDCLLLNIWTPAVAHDLSPVLVWIHGGGMAFGGGSTYNGSTLAQRHNAVGVTINYRLGLLGFLSFTDQLQRKECTGNFGLQDQQSALRFVQRNIGTFGGDASKVLIFGQSAGGSSVHKHLLMPQSKGLFSAAIMQSGTITYW